MPGNSYATLEVSSSTGYVNGRTCYSCSGCYQKDVRFCPRDGTDLDYLPPPLEEMARDFVRPKKTRIALSIMFALLMISSAFMLDNINSANSVPGNQPTVGGIAVRTTPPGAVVYLDGSKVGVSPMRLSDVPAGLHEVRVVFPGYSDGKADVEILPSSIHRLVWDLAPLPSQKKKRSRLLVESSPVSRNTMVAMSASAPLVKATPFQLLAVTE